MKVHGSLHCGHVRFVAEVEQAARDQRGACWRMWMRLIPLLGGLHRRLTPDLP
jgi:hypothetical protein